MMVFGTYDHTITHEHQNHSSQKSKFKMHNGILNPNELLFNKYPNELISKIQMNKDPNELISKIQMNKDPNVQISKKIDFIQQHT
jgi:hypothetical protein